MSDRITKKDVVRAFRWLCEIMNKEMGDKPGQWDAENIPCYGGYVVVEYRENGGESHPFGLLRRKTTAFYDFLMAMVEGIEAFTGKTRHEIMREYQFKKVKTLWEDISADELKTIVWIADRYESGEYFSNMIGMAVSYPENEATYRSVYYNAKMAYSAGESDGADKGTIPCLGGRLLDKWQQTIKIYKLDQKES